MAPMAKGEKPIAVWNLQPGERRTPAVALTSAAPRSIGYASSPPTWQSTKTGSTPEPVAGPSATGYSRLASFISALTERPGAVDALLVLPYRLRSKAPNSP